MMIDGKPPSFTIALSKRCQSVNEGGLLLGDYMEFQYQLLPNLTDEEYKSLKDDIAKRGKVLVPIEVDENGAILDGHHRVRAWSELTADGVKVEPYARIIRFFIDENEKRNHVRALNILRRHLTKDQMREQWEQMRQDGMTYSAIAEVSGVAESNVRSSVSQKCGTQPDYVTGKDGKKYPSKKRKKNKGKTEQVQPSYIFDVPPAATTFDDVKKSSRKEEREQANAEKHTSPIPAGKYKVIYADPPWQYNNSGFDEAAESQYPTMPVDEICALAVPELTDETTVLFLWATNPLLKDALQVLEAWGFEYKTNIAWVKDKGRGKGWYLKSKHELLLIGVKSNTPHPLIRPDSAQVADRGLVHSRKPELFCEIIETMYLGSKIELFARSTRPGWDCWGNEV